MPMMRPRLLLTTALAAGAVALATAVAPASAQLDQDQPDPFIADGGAQRELDAARALWRKQRIRSYRWTVTRSCFCPPLEPGRITVRGGAAVRPPEAYRQIATVTRMFQRIQEAIDAKAARLDVRYSPKRGVPTRVYIDRSLRIADEEIGFTSSRLTPLR